VLYVEFTQRFVENPTKPNERKNNPKIFDKTRKNKKWGAAFLSILFHHWTMLQQKYDGNIEKALEASGLLKETLNYLCTQNIMLKFKLQYMEKVEGEKIYLTEFCRMYALYYGDTYNKKYSADEFTAEAKSNFGDELYCGNGEEFIIGYRMKYIPSGR
jgi:hypothetical protein